MGLLIFFPHLKFWPLPIWKALAFGDRKRMPFEL
jgi:hypothetical protein